MYCKNDLEESLKISPPESKPIRIMKAWGKAELPDVCCHMDWSGGFVMLLENGRYAYLSGWCDYTGWGCQDGSEIRYSDTIDGLNLPTEEKWDDMPADLNKWLDDGMTSWEEQ